MTCINLPRPGVARPYVPAARPRAVPLEQVAVAAFRGLLHHRSSHLRRAHSCAVEKCATVRGSQRENAPLAVIAGRKQDYTLG
jgi:hypothetical protein